MSGAEAAQPDRMGTFLKGANVTHGERPVYQRAGSAVMYLFYWPLTDEWRIGGNYMASSSGVKSTDSTEAACPDQATGWEEFSGGKWVGTYPIAVVRTTVGNAPATAACGPV